jgi:cytochrome c553
MLIRYLLPVVTVALLATNAFGQTKTAQQLIGSCSRCHGEDGNASGQYPSLAGQQKAYLVKQLMDYKSGARKNSQMAPMAGVLTEEDVHVLGGYYADEFLKRPRGVDKELAAKGEKIATELNCASCHQKNYRGAEVIPRLARQNRTYLVNQMKYFRDGKRTNDNGLKAELMSGLTDEQIKFLSHYLAGK